MTTRPTFVLCASLFMAASISPAQAGFFESLFGMRAPAPAPEVFYRDYRDKSAPRRRSARAALPRPSLPQPALGKAAATTLADRALVMARVVEFMDLMRTRGAFAAFLLDPTLRRGDALVTEAGIRIFTGSKGKTHLASELRPLARTRVANRGGLMELERVSRLGGGFQVVASAAPAAVPLTIVPQPAGAATGIIVVKPKSLSLR